jgi:hypothetical protein
MLFGFFEIFENIILEFQKKFRKIEMFYVDNGVVYQRVKFKIEIHYISGCKKNKI